MSTKEKQIEEYLKKPVVIGDNVYVRGLGIQDKSNWGNTTKVLKVNEDESIVIMDYSEKTIKKEDYKKNTTFIGYAPIVEKPWNSSLQITNFDLESTLYSVGFEKRKMIFSTVSFGNTEVEELNWNPFIVDKNGKEILYQRDFVWSLKEKQSLIDSIYNNIDIGKIVIRKRPYQWVEKRIKQGKQASFKDIVDGKQRLNAIIGFVQNKFPDSNGFYFDDFSDFSKAKFFSFKSFAYGELGEKASDEDVKSVFLGLNFTGVPMSQEHIDFVKSINI